MYQNIIGVDPLRETMGEVTRVEVRHLGTVAYTDALDQMKGLQKQRIEDEIPDVMLILEHPEIVTVGPRARNDGITPPEGYAHHPVDRGGGLTWHGPGQLVVYPIFKCIEAWIIQALSQCGIESQRDERMQGVWVDGHKIASIGLSFLRWTSRHGFTININTPPGRVEGLAGCGLNEQTTTCLQRLGHEVEQNAIIDALLSTMQQTVNRNPEVRSIED